MKSYKELTHEEFIEMTNKILNNQNNQNSQYLSISDRVDKCIEILYLNKDISSNEASIICELKNELKNSNKINFKPIFEKDPEIVFAVDYVEVEFGMRDEGTSLYIDLNHCKKETIKNSEKGVYKGGGGYYGPIRPLVYFETPFFSLEEKYKEKLRERGVAHTDNWWSPKFKGVTKSIYEEKETTQKKKTKEVSIWRKLKPDGPINEWQ